MHKASSQPAVRLNITQHYMSIIVIRPENICICLYKDTALKILYHNGVNFFKAILKFYLGPRILGVLCRPLCVLEQKGGYCWPQRCVCNHQSQWKSTTPEKHFSSAGLGCVSTWTFCDDMNGLYLCCLILNPFFTLVIDHLKYDQYDLEAEFSISFNCKINNKIHWLLFEEVQLQEKQNPKLMIPCPLASRTRCLHSSP